VGTQQIVSKANSTILSLALGNLGEKVADGLPKAQPDACMTIESFYLMRA